MEDQLRSALRFFRAKRKALGKDVETEFEDQIESLTDMYNKDEVELLLQGLCTSVTASVKADAEKSAHMSCLLLRQLFEGAEKYGVDDLELNLAAVEDHGLLLQMAKLKIDGPSESKSKSRKKNLVSIGNEHKKMMTEMSNIKSENETLRARFKLIQTQCTTLISEKNALKEQLDTMGSMISSMEGSSKRSASSDSDTIRSLSKQIKQAQDRMAKQRSHINYIEFNHHLSLVTI